MSRTIRIGLNIAPSDPFWIEVSEAIHQGAQQLGVEVLSVYALYPDLPRLTEEEETAQVEMVLAQELDAIIGWDFSAHLAQRVLDADVPIICHGSEIPLDHPLMVVRDDLYAAAQLLGTYLTERLGGCGNVLIVGGLLLNRKEGGDGQGRLAGLRDCFQTYPQIRWTHIPSSWVYDIAHAQIYAALETISEPLDAIVGLSDTVALAARDATKAGGCLGPNALITGINGDTLALAGIRDGTYTATVETSATDLGSQMIDLAYRAAKRLPHPKMFSFKRMRLVTSENVTEVAAEKLVDIANLPTRLVGVQRYEEHQRSAQLEITLEISRNLGSILNRWQLSHEIKRLIRENYGYDHAQIFLWSESEQRLVLHEPEAAHPLSLTIAEAGVLGLAMQRNELIFIPDAQHSSRFSPDPRWPMLRSRVILPIPLGQRLVGLLDLYSERFVKLTRQELVGLQSLAVQLGITIRNAELYSAALEGNQAKSTFLASMSHELRTPLNAILNFTEFMSLGLLGPINGKQSDALRKVLDSGKHLLALINDLLDMTKIEAGMMRLFVEENIDIQQIIASVTSSILPLLKDRPVELIIDIDEDLPSIVGDQRRIGQILLNLLSNAAKFTEKGKITLSVKKRDTEILFAVADTGPGIPRENQTSIFEPFVQTETGIRQASGTGLGLPISRTLAEAHGGKLWLESEPDQGATFFVTLPVKAQAFVEMP
jgi:signal transduction histidine kinase/ABC-type sugar transport system substrate-binding protein